MQPVQDTSSKYSLGDALTCTTVTIVYSFRKTRRVGEVHRREEVVVGGFPPCAQRTSHRCAVSGTSTPARTALGGAGYLCFSATEVDLFGVGLRSRRRNVGEVRKDEGTVVALLLGFFSCSNVSQTSV